MVLLGECTGRMTDPNIVLSVLTALRHALAGRFEAKLHWKPRALPAPGEACSTGWSRKCGASIPLL